MDAVWDNYNAKGLPAESLAKSFVQSSYFTKLCSPKNSVLIGSRGSGKTTLLRMLEPRALDIWSASNGESLDNVDFVGVFVPIDAVFIKGLSARISQKSKIEQSHFALMYYSLSICNSLWEVFNYRISPDSQFKGNRFHCDFNDQQEVQLVRALDDLWFGKTGARSLLELKLALIKKLSDVSSLSSAISDSLINPLSLAHSSCEIFNTIALQPHKLWAFLCDELEIAPVDVSEYLFAALRAMPKNFRLKIALAPASKPFSLQVHGNIGSPIPENDFDVISLTYGTRKEGEPEKARTNFCRDICQNMLNEKWSKCDVYKSFEDPVQNREAFKELYEADSTFKEFLDGKVLDPYDSDNWTTAQKDAVTRKIAAIVEIRTFFLNFERQTRISRKSFQPYLGIKRLFDLSEGHPRWIKSTIGSMIVKAEKTKISLALQNRSLGDSIQFLLSRIRAIPKPINSPESVHTFVERIGKHFAEEVLGTSFSADPILSFEVDSDCEDWVSEIMESALRIGVIVPMQSDSTAAFYEGIVGHRFRISNWLAPYFKIPILAGKCRKLSIILDQKSRLVLDGALPSQLELGFAHD